MPSMSRSSFARDVAPKRSRHKMIGFHFPLIMSCTSSKGQVYSVLIFIGWCPFPLFPNYFGRKPFPLKQKRPLNYTIKFICFSPDGTKRLFFGNGKQKRAIAQPFSSRYHFSIFLYTITQNSILSRKLIYKHGNSMQFPCLYYISRLSTAFSVKLIRLSAKNP